MPSKNFKMILSSTATLIRCFYQRSALSLSFWLNPSTVWIDGSQSCACQGIAQIEQHMRALQLMPQEEISDIQYRIIYVTNDIYIVFGQHVRSQKKLEHVSVIWKFGKQPQCLLLCHISTEQIGEAGCLKKQPDLYEPYPFRGVNGETYFVRMTEIVYAEANDMHCILHCTERDICVRMYMKEMEAILPENFVRIHRSFVINRRFLMKMRRYEVLMTDKIVLPIPEKKYAEVRGKLIAFYHAKT